MSAVLFSLLVATGVLLIFVYKPAPGLAYESIVSLRNDVFFGSLVRNIHHWSANFLIVIVVLHLARVYLTGGYTGPRQFNWVIGLLLLTCVLISNFTGYLLPWDQLSYWAITIVTGMIGYVPFVGDWLQGVLRGGPEIGQETLIIFYAAHTSVMPVIIVVLMAFHFWRIRKARGVVIPRSEDEEPDEKPAYVLALPHLLLRELAVALVLIAFVMVFAVAFDAPLGDPANPGMSTNPAKAPWYFMGFQELQLHFHPLFSVLIIPLLAVMGLVLIPYVTYDHDTSGVFMVSRKGRRLGLMAAITAVVVAPLWIVADEFWVDLGAWLTGTPPAISNGLLPTVILIAALSVFYALLKKRRAASNNEMIQAMFILLTVVFAVLTITGIWFRGPGMALTWPWGT